MTWSLTSPAAVSRRCALLGSAIAALGGRLARAGPSLPTRVRVILGGNLGSTHELHARALAAALEHEGLVQKAIVDVIARAGGKLAAKTLNEVRADGATIALLPTGLIYADLLGEDGVAFSMARFRWIGSTDIDSRMLVVARRLGIDRIDDLRSRADPIATATGSATSQGYYETLLVNRLLGTRLRPVTGFGGSGRQHALSIGEVGAAILSLDAGRPLLERDEVVPLVRMGPQPLPPPHDRVPTLVDLVAAADRSLTEIVELNARFGRWFCLPPATPDAIVARWRQAFDVVVAGDVLRRRVADAALGRSSVQSTRGSDIEAALTALRGREAELRAMLKDAMRCGAALGERGPRTC